MLIAIKNKLDMLSLPVDSYKTGQAVFAKIHAPADYTGNKFITMYESGDSNRSIEYRDDRVTIDCWSVSHSLSRILAEQVVSILNRTHNTGYFYVCSMLQTLPPPTGETVYKTPVELRVKSK